MRKRSYTLYKLSTPKQNFIRSENVIFVQDFIVTIRWYAVLKFLFFISFPQENLKEPEKKQEEKVFLPATGFVSILVKLPGQLWKMKVILLILDSSSLCQASKWQSCFQNSDKLQEK